MATEELVLLGLAGIFWFAFLVSGYILWRKWRAIENDGRDLEEVHGEMEC